MPRIRIDAVLIQAVIAGALSFAHLHDLAEAAGQDGWKAWAYPVSVDLLLVAAWRRMRTTADNRAAWAWFVIALAASLGANVATAGLLDLGDVPAWLRILVAGWPALAFLGGTLLVHAPTTAPAEPDPVPAAAPPVAPAAKPVPGRDGGAGSRTGSGTPAGTGLRARPTACSGSCPCGGSAGSARPRPEVGRRPPDRDR
ncbi:hypothetical protein SCALM49S_00754 [Streptomyces californicus]